MENRKKMKKSEIILFKFCTLPRYFVLNIRLRHNISVLA